MLREGVETIEDVRRRFDGERRNPWDEPECGHHYARAMSAWSSVIAYTGFDYHGVDKAIALMPNSRSSPFTSFYSTGLAWGTFSIVRTAGSGRLELSVTEGSLPLRSVRLPLTPGAKSSVTLGGRSHEHTVERRDDAVTIVLASDLVIRAGEKMVVQV
jgi:non-lysosomal glucosylceramidase